MVLTAIFILIMGFLIDGIIGPILKTFGVIEIDQDGEWRKTEKKPKGNGLKSLLDRIRGYLFSLLDKLKSKRQITSKKDVGVPRQDEVKKTEKHGNLRKITKFEGKALMSEGYRLYYSTRFPKDYELEEGVVYVVEGQGEPIAYSGPLSGIRFDGYYVWDEERN